MLGLVPALMITGSPKMLNGAIKTPVPGGRSGSEKSQLSCIKKSICIAVAMP